MTSHSRALVAIMFVNFVTIAGFGFMFPVFAVYGKAINASATEIALAIAAFSLGQFISSPLWGQISDKHGRKTVLVLSLLLGAVLVWLNVFAVTPWLLILARFASGLAAGSFSVAFAVAADISTAENRTRVMGIVGAGFSLGFIMGPAIGGFAAGNDTGPEAFARVCYFGAALFAAGALVTIFALPETLKRHAPDPAVPQPPEAPRLSMFRNPVMALTITLALISSLALANMEATFAIFADDILSLSPTGIGLIFAVMGVIGVSVQFAGAGPLSRLMGEQTMALMALCFLSVGMIIVGSSTGLVQALIGMCVIASGFSTINPALSGMTSMAASGNSQGAALGLMQSASSLGRVIGPAAAGVVYDVYGPSAPFYSAAGILLITIAGTVLWLRRRVSVNAG